MLIELLTAKYPGMRLWLTQRLSAVFMMAYLLLFVYIIATKQPEGHTDWLGIFTPIWWRVLTVLFFMSLFTHAWLGVRDVLRDYIFNVTTRAWIQLLVDIALIVYMFWVIVILWQV